jgi:hypothetical protein
VWQSLLSAQELLKQGLVWSVGDETSIHIWGDKWLPTSNNYMVQSVPRLLDAQALVSCLINSVTKGWNLELLATIFNEEEVKVISNIPLNPMQPHDRLVWSDTSNGLFSFWSAYHLSKEI